MQNSVLMDCGSLAAPSESPLFQSFFMGGFECATHTRRDGRRLDLLGSTHHDSRTSFDYRLLQEAGIRTVRDGLRWNRIEVVAGRYDWSGFLPMLRAAHETDTEVIWDLCHWGVPAWLDPFSADFVRYFNQYAESVAETIATERLRAGVSGAVYVCPINEISFWSWIGGEVAQFGPYGLCRGTELKMQLVRATICASRTLRNIIPEVRLVQAEPIVHITPGSDEDHAIATASMHHAAQFEAWDMLSGRSLPELGGSEDLLDILGANYYWNNQWVDGGERTPPGHRSHVPLHKLLLTLHERYGRPMLLSETGAEGETGLGWLGMVCAEVRRAQKLGARIHGICTYPITDYPGWDDGRHVTTGLIALDSNYEQRSLRSEFASELALQRQMFASPN